MFEKKESTDATREGFGQIMMALSGWPVFDFSDYPKRKDVLIQMQMK